MKVPSGLLFVDEVVAEVQSCPIQIALNLAHQHGVIVHSITCDCTNVNPKTMSLRGCRWLDDHTDDLNAQDPTHMNGSQLDPVHTNGQETHLILDAYHLLKLARNALAPVEVMVNGQGQVIKGDHIVGFQ